MNLAEIQIDSIDIVDNTELKNDSDISDVYVVVGVKVNNELFPLVFGIDDVDSYEFAADEEDDNYHDFESSFLEHREIASYVMLASEAFRSWSNYVRDMHGVDASRYTPSYTINKKSLN